MESIDLDREVEKMLALENANDNRFATLQSQMSTLMEQVQALTKQAAESCRELNTSKLPTDQKLQNHQWLSKRALFDTGSQISILPLKILLEAQESGFDLDTDVEEIKAASKEPVYDASGNEMKFLGAVVATVTRHGASPQRVAMFVRKSKDDIVILGTNALHKLNMVLQKKEKGKSNQVIPHRKHRHVSDALKTNSALFPSFPGYNIESYYAQAVERLDQIPRDYDDSLANPTIIALPLAFLRAEKDLEETDRAKVMVYTTLDGLACQLNQCPITAAIVLVWPDVMPSSHHISHLMRALERHLQCGGTLDMYPPPYEERRSEAWHEIKESSRRTIKNTVPLGNPCTSLGTSPRNGDCKFHPWQVAVFLNQVRKFAMSTITLPIFFPKKRTEREEDNADTGSTRRQSTPPPNPKKKKPTKPQVMYLRDAKRERDRYAPHMKQHGKQFKKK
ncbi:unnamed protein product [Heligmosomoides polygyrus]|uniref:Peptidase A2 domain-containing protein n=1 Tax=Heligmosomoides polygyrus TaxID=6339 RepID=A0A183FFZ7_HELPZ|nr:unnamed protein product [Heligmosomoides polygyrus]